MRLQNPIPKAAAAGSVDPRLMVQFKLPVCLVIITLVGGLEHWFSIGLMMINDG